MNIFDKYSREYDRWYDKYPYVFRNEVLALEKVLPLEGRGIEIGVGTGRFASALKIKNGIDPSLSMLKLARKRGVSVKRAFGEKLPYKDSSFDYAVLVFTLCFLNDPTKAFGELKRILKPSGSLIVGFIDKNSILGKKYSAKKSGYYKKAKFYTVRQVKVFMKKAGFSVTAVKQTLFKNPKNIEKIENPLSGHGKGGFVVMKGVRN